MRPSSFLRPASRRGGGRGRCRGTDVVGVGARAAAAGGAAAEGAARRVVVARATSTTTIMSASATAFDVAPPSSSSMSISMSMSMSSSSSLAHPRRLSSSSAGTVTRLLSTAIDGDADDDRSASPEAMTTARRPRAKATSFFDEVDAIMERDHPARYLRFLESRAAHHERRDAMRRNEMSRGRRSSAALPTASAGGGGWEKHDDEGEATTSMKPTTFDHRDWDEEGGAPPSWGKAGRGGRRPDATSGRGGIASAADHRGDPPPLAEFAADHDARVDRRGDSAMAGGGGAAGVDIGMLVAPAPDEEPTPWYKRVEREAEAPRPSSHKRVADNGNGGGQQRRDVVASSPPAEKMGGGGGGGGGGAGGIFSSISRSSAIRLGGDGGDGDGVGAASVIKLSELFPTLYADEKAESDGSTREEKRRRRRPVDPAAVYDENDFETYVDALNAVLVDSRGAMKPLRKFASRSPLHERAIEMAKGWLRRDERVLEERAVRERWETLEGVWRNDRWMTGVAANAEEEEEDVEGIKEKTAGERFKSELREQRKVFLAKLLLEEMEEEKEEETRDTPTADADGDAAPSNGEMSEEIIGPLFHDATQQILGSLGRYCARRARSAPLAVAWHKVKESGTLLPRDVVSTYLYIAGTMGTSMIMSSDSRGGAFPLTDGGDDDEDGGYDDNNAASSSFRIPEEVATYHDLLSRPTESSISMRIRALASRGDEAEAEVLLEAFKKSIEAEVDGKEPKEVMRLRTYLPILKRYCEKRDVASALSLFRRMQSTPGVVLETENWIEVLSAIAENGYFRDDSPPVDGAREIGYGSPSGPGLFDEIASEMASNALEITSASARRLSNALARGFGESRREEDGGNNGGDDLDDAATAVVSNLREVHPLVSMPLSREPAKDNVLVAGRVSLDRSTGVCPVTGAQQRLIVLEPDQRKQLHTDLLELSTEQFAKFAGKKPGDSPNRAREQLQIFSNWLDKREGEPFTAIVDGANIGYYMQSFDKGKFNYHQIKFMVDTLEERGENPLVVLPSKYGYNEFFSSRREHQRLDWVEAKIKDDLIQQGKLYKVPPRCLDDFYWMLASVSDQAATRDGRDLSVPTDDPNGRFPGARPMLVSNDQMRDHKLELLEPRLFRRWYGCHIVNYNFTAFVLGESVAGNEIGFSMADLFSREIQGNPSRAEDASEWGGLAWHFPVNDWDLDERFVVRIPAKKEQN